jgi:hypothetical protein
VNSQPEGIQPAPQDSSTAQQVLQPEPIIEVDQPLVLDVVAEKPAVVGFNSITAAPGNSVEQAGAIEPDEILAQPSQLRQAAQSVVVPVQTKPQPWNSNTLLAGLIGLAVFALIAGLVVARRGVPGAIAS